MIKEKRKRFDRVSTDTEIDGRYSEDIDIYVKMSEWTRGWTQMTCGMGMTGCLWSFESDML